MVLFEKIVSKMKKAEWKKLKKYFPNGVAKKLEDIVGCGLQKKPKPSEIAQSQIVEPT